MKIKLGLMSPYFCPKGGKFSRGAAQCSMPRRPLMVRAALLRRSCDGAATELRRSRCCDGAAQTSSVALILPRAAPSRSFCTAE